MALATTVSAASCPTTRSRSRCSMCTSFFTSPSSIRETGMPVHLLTILAMSSSSTSSFSMRATPLPAFMAASCCAFNLRSSASIRGNSPYWICAARSSWPLRVCSSASKRSASISFFRLADARDRLALLRPARPQRSNLLLNRRQFALHFLQALAAVLVGLALQRRALDLQRRGLALQLIDLRRHAIRSGWPAKPRPRPPGRWPCRAGSGR